MLCSPFYGFKNNFQKQTNDKGPFDGKSGGLCKNIIENCYIIVPSHILGNMDHPVFQCKFSIRGNMDHHRIYAAVLRLNIITSLF